MKNQSDLVNDIEAQNARMLAEANAIPGHEDRFYTPTSDLPERQFTVIETPVTPPASRNPFVRAWRWLMARYQTWRASYPRQRCDECNKSVRQQDYLVMVDTNNILCPACAKAELALDDR